MSNFPKTFMHCRRKLHQKFDETVETEKCEKSTNSERFNVSKLSMNDTRKVLRNGAERITKTLNVVRTSFGTLSQKFRVSTKRRQILEEGPMTPHSKTKQVLGRTPTKMYSPFTIESPCNPKNKENIPDSNRIDS